MSESRALLLSSLSILFFFPLFSLFALSLPLFLFSFFISEHIYIYTSSASVIAFFLLIILVILFSSFVFGLRILQYTHGHVSLF
jgi:hypothetical protein